jgi:hypothetical protein
MARPGAILASPGQSEYGNGTDQTSENDMNVYGSDAEVPPAGGPKSQIGNTAKGKTYYGE